MRQSIWWWRWGGGGGAETSSAAERPFYIHMYSKCGLVILLVFLCGMFVQNKYSIQKLGCAREIILLLKYWWFRSRVYASTYVYIYYWYILHTLLVHADIVNYYLFTFCSPYFEGVVFRQTQSSWCGGVKLYNIIWTWYQKYIFYVTQLYTYTPCMHVLFYWCLIYWIQFVFECYSRRASCCFQRKYIHALFVCIEKWFWPVVCGVMNVNYIYLYIGKIFSRTDDDGTYRLYWGYFYL